jgi:hypothetical protein
MSTIDVPPWEQMKTEGKKIKKRKTLCTWNFLSDCQQMLPHPPSNIGHVRSESYAAGGMRGFGVSAALK